MKQITRVDELHAHAQVAVLRLLSRVGGHSGTAQGNDASTSCEQAADASEEAPLRVTVPGG